MLVAAGAVEAAGVEEVVEDAAAAVAVAADEVAEVAEEAEVEGVAAPLRAILLIKARRLLDRGKRPEVAAGEMAERGRWRGVAFPASGLSW